MKDLVKINYYSDKKQIEKEIHSIQILQKEKRYPVTFRMPLTLQFELTTHCNVKCKHCYNNSGANNDSHDAMTPQAWKNFARYLVQRGGLFQCVISGGEPLLLGDDLFDIMDILHEDRTIFHVISNCYLMTEEKVHRFAKYHYKWFQVSIDGANAERHDIFRQRQGSWIRATQAAYWISKEGIPLTIAHSVVPENLCEIDEMCRLAYELGASAIILGEVTPSGRSANNADLILSYQEKMYLQERIAENIAKYAGRMAVQRSSAVKNQLLRYRDTPNVGAIIRPNGDIRLDCMVPFTIGNVLEDDFCKIWTEKASSCWQHPAVQEYIDGYQEFFDINERTRNYYDQDQRL